MNVPEKTVTAVRLLCLLCAKRKAPSIGLWLWGIEAHRLVRVRPSEWWALPQKGRRDGVDEGLLMVKQVKEGIRHGLLPYYPCFCQLFKPGD